MQYNVIGPDGSKYGPAGIDLLQQWINEERIVPSTMLEAVESGEQVAASQVGSLQFKSASAPAVGGPVSFSQPAVVQTPQQPLYGAGQPQQPLYGAGRPGAPIGYGYAQANTSGTDGPLPDEIARLKWNWGAFVFNWLWLVCMNRVAAGLGLLVILGVLGVINVLLLMNHVIGQAVDFIVGSIIQYTITGLLAWKGNALAWRSRRFDSVEHYIAVQKVWMWVGIVFFTLSMLYQIVSVIIQVIAGK